MSSRLVSRSRGIPAWVSTAALLAAFFPDLRSQQNLADTLSAEVKQVFEERKDAVVQVESVDQYGKRYGTGFFTDPAGNLFTLAIVVANAQEIYVIQGDKRIPAKLLVADPRSGIALLQAECNSPFIPVGSSRNLQMASPIITIGYPMDLGATPSFGMVGGFDRKFLGKYLVTTHIRANVPVQRGFAGSPLMNMNGEAVGILMSGIDGFSGCYALPIEAAEKIRVDYTRFGEVRHGWVGVKVENQDEAIDGSRAKIAELEPDTPAAKSGLHDGDILLQIGEVPIKEVEDILDASFFLTAGDQTAVTVLREGHRMTINVRSIRHPASEEQQPAIPATETQDMQALIPSPEPLLIDDSK